MIHWKQAASRVLIVDDSEEHVRLVRRALTVDGYSCESEPDGRRVIEICHAGCADVVLLDVHMPRIDGLTVCRHLKASPETCLIPVLMTTADTGGRSHLAALEAGADDFLQKPIVVAELRARVRSATRMKRYIDELDDAAASIVMLGATIEARDRHTSGHCRRLAEYASALGMRIGLDRYDLHALQQGGYVHDLGKIAISDAVLFKPAPLTHDEFELIKTHPIIGDRICSPLRTLERARRIVRSHHELLDGTGYPDGLRGAAVPLLAQVTAVADVYDALTSDRPYRRALPAERALETLRDEAKCGKRDAALVEEFAALIVDGESPSIAHQSSDLHGSNIALLSSR